MTREEAIEAAVRACTSHATRKAVANREENQGFVEASRFLLSWYPLRVKAIRAEFSRIWGGMT